MKKFVLLILFLSSSYSFSEGMRIPLSANTQYFNLSLSSMGLELVDYFYSKGISAKKLYEQLLEKCKKAEKRVKIRNKDFAEGFANLKIGGSH